MGHDACQRDIERVMADLRQQALAEALRLPQMTYAEFNEALLRTTKGEATPEDEAAGKQWGEAMRRASGRGIAFAGWRIYLDVNVFQDMSRWHGSASLYPRDRCSSSDDWRHLTMIASATASDEDNARSCADQIERQKNGTIVIHWMFSEAPDP